jgi:hypothetical protein
MHAIYREIVAEAEDVLKLFFDFSTNLLGFNPLRSLLIRSHLKRAD